jgi:hypothetical protein
VSREITAEQIDTSDSHGRLARADALRGKCWICGREGQEIKITRTHIEFESPGYWLSCRNGCSPR